MKLLLAGYFGCGNLGDDAILLGFHCGIEGKGYETKTLCGNAEGLMRQYGMQGVYRKDLNSVGQAIRECDALVFPGGSIFQDATSTRSVAYYSKLALDAKKAGKKVVMLGQGVGPLTGFFGKRMATSAFKAADLVVVRDPASGAALRSMGVEKVRIAADMAFLLPEPSLSEGSSAGFGVAGTKSVGISARPWGKDRNKAVIKLFGEFAQILSRNGYIPTFIEMDSALDGPLILEIAKTLGGKVPDMRNLGSPRAVQERLQRMHAVVAMRLHAGILATTVGVPVFLLSYDPKVSAFANAIGMPAPPQLQGLTAQRLFDGFQSFIQDRDRVAEGLKRRREDLAKEAQKNIEALEAVLRP
ncbi:MAG: polysaccharide pyruvyl transferase CsaB [Fimbriimonadaceae bacterium]|nr:polysaccharide pyruvyl transferase CsaB [Fimbriimonadaceae bacterium]QYK56384.1 MAG: polysaccharide pyruvyl transferase CsaB [Fimbriimonadaceae bacterium]